MAVALLLCALLSTSWSDAATDRQKTERQIKQLQSDIRKIESRLRSAKGEQKALQQALRNTEVTAGKLNREIKANRRQIDRIGQQLLALGEEAKLLQKLQAEQSTRLADQLDAAYRAGRQDRLKLLLNQQDPQRVSRLLKYHDYLSRARVESLREFQQTLAELARTETELEQTQQQLADQQQALEQRLNRLQGSRADREKALASLKREIGGEGRRLKALQGDSARLQKVLQELSQVLALNDLSPDTEAFAKLKGQLIWPTQGRVTQNYGSRNSLGVKSEGMLISTGMGERVNAVHHGRVVFSDWLRGFGLLLIVDHGGGYMTLYGHNQSLLKEIGDWVAAGEAVATVGDSGGQSNPGLYFAVRHQGNPRNPKSWLSKRQG